MELRMMGNIPDQVVPVAAFDPALPLPAKDGMHFPGKEVGKNKGPDGEWYRLKKVFIFRFESGRRVCIDFEFDFDNLPPGDLPDDPVCRLYDQQLFRRIGFQEGRLNLGILVLFSYGQADFTPERPNFFLQGARETGKIKAISGPEKREIKVLRESVQSIKNPQGCPAVKSSLVEKLASPEPQKRNLLKELPKRPDGILHINRFVTLEQSG